MRELTVTELDVVSGGLNLDNYNLTRAEIAAMQAIVNIPTFRAAAKSFGIGYAIGQFINNHTPVQQWIADALPDPGDFGNDKLEDEAGTDYCGCGTDYH